MCRKAVTVSEGGPVIPHVWLMENFRRYGQAPGCVALLPLSKKIIICGHKNEGGGGGERGREGGREGEKEWEGEREDGREGEKGEREGGSK